MRRPDRPFRTDDPLEAPIPRSEIPPVPPPEDPVASIVLRWADRPAPARPGPAPDAGASPLVRAILEAAGRRPSAPAFVDDAAEVPWERYAAAISEVAGRLRSRPDWFAGDRVAIDPDLGAALHAAAFHGILLAGGVAVPLPPGLSEAGVRDRISWTDCRLRMGVAPGGTPWELGAGVGDGGRPVDADAPAALLFTSGSGGGRKAVSLSHRNLIANARAIVTVLDLGPHDRALATVPLQHAFGNSVLQSHLVAGGAVVDGRETGPFGALDAVGRHAVTHLYAIPDGCVLLERLLRGRSAPESLRGLGVAGGRLAPSLALSLAEALGPARLHVMYGQTEATARLSVLPPEALAERPDSIGLPIPGIRIEVVDGAGRSVEPGATGEIRARGESVSLGYWRDPEETARILRDGWLYTRDLGTVDEDGFLYHRGRADDLVKVAGRRVDLGRIAREAERSTSATRCVAVVFETAPGAERIALFCAGSDEARDEVVEWCRRSLPEDERPVHVETLTRFPTLGSGKPDAASLARRARSAWRGDRT